MGASGPAERERRVRVLARVCALAAAFLAALTLYSWATGSSWPVNVYAESAALKPETCVTVLILAASVGLAAQARPSRREEGARVALAVGGGAIAATALLEYAVGRDLGIDLLLFPDVLLATGVSPAGRMSLLTAIFLLCIAVALGLQRARRRGTQQVGEAASVCTVIACYVILGFHLHGRSAEGLSTSLQPVSLSSALSLFLLGLATLVARPDRGWLVPVLRDDAGGHLLRRMLPAAGLLPFALGIAVVWGATHGLYDVRAGLLLLIASVCLPLAILVVWSARSANRLASERTRSELRLRRLIEASPIGIAFGDLAGRVTAANDAYLRILGRSQDDLVAGQLDWRGGTSADHRARDAAAFAELERSGITRPYEKEVVLPDGTRRPVLAGAMRLSDDDDFAVTLVDITRQRNAQAKLRQSETRYRRIVETAHEGVCIVDAEGHVRFANARLAHMLGSPEEHLLGRRFLSLVHDEDRDVWAPLLRTDAAPAQPAGDLRLRCPDGEEMWAIVSVGPIEAGDGLPEGRLVMLTDVTARRRSELALQQAARIEATSTLAAGIAHDVNNLMAVVLGNADLLREEIAGRGDAAEMVDAMREAASRTSELAQQLLAYARGGRYWSRPVDLNDVVQRTLEIHRRSWPRQIEVKVHLETQLPSVMADASQMSQIVMNLCANGVEAMDGRGHLAISTHSQLVQAGGDARGPAGRVSLSPGRWVCLSVHDEGCGMDSLTAARVFEPFFSTKFPGRGLGLAAVYGIVQNHGGEIVVDTVPRRGTRFDVWLPASLEAPVTEAAREAGEPPTGTETVLVVDDEERVLTVTARLLEKLGYRVLRARNGREAVAFARTGDVAIDAVILDLDMPVMDGATAFPLLRAARPGVPVIVCSGYELDPSSPRLQGVDADGYLSKPFRRDSLARLLREAIDAAAGTVG